MNGIEPKLEDFPHEPLDAIPRLVMPAERQAPTWDPPPLRLPRWTAPCEPRPVGFLRGTAPILIIDVSGEQLSRPSP